MTRTRGRKVLSVGRKKKRTVQRWGQRLLNHEPLEDRRLLAVVTDMGDSGPGTLRDAIDNTTDAVITFEVDNVNLTSGQIIIDRDILIDGSTAPSGAVTIDGGASGHIFSISDGSIDAKTVEIRDAVIQNGTFLGQPGAGAIRSFENLTLTRVTGQNNYARFDGGFLRHSNGTLTITDSVITNNRAARHGGGIDVLSADSVTITGSTLSNNQTGVDSAGNAVPVSSGNPTKQGGALRVTGATNLMIDDSTISGNTAIALGAPGLIAWTLGGGEFFDVGNRDINISNLIVSDNVSTYYDPGGYGYDNRGGGLYLSGSTNTYIDNVLVSGNTAIGFGSGILTSDYGNVNVTNSMITGNYGPGGSAGAGIEVISFGGGAANLTVSDSTITGNTSNFGAGVQVAQGSHVTLNRVNIYGNYSYASGAAVYAVGFDGQNDNQTVINESTLQGNTTTIRGGAVAANTVTGSSGGRVTVNNSTISGNSSGSGGGVYVNDSYATIYQSTVSGNSAGSGGGVYFGSLNAQNDDSNIDRSTITNNYAFVGSGVYGGYYPTINVSDTIISGNLGASDDFYAGNPMNPAPTYSYIGGNAMLGALADNGGDTLSHLPMAGSPVIDAADPTAGQMAGDRDQRRSLTGAFGDPVDDDRAVGGRMDMGAVETGAEFIPNDTAVTGDFNDDMLWDCLDIDALTTAIANGSMDLSFDMNGDGSITFGSAMMPGDVIGPDGWLAVAGSINLMSGNAYGVGDANLDGIVDGLDFIQWNANKFTTNSNWCDGDFNADGIVDGLDFIEWNANKFTQQGPITVAPGDNVNTDVMGQGELNSGPRFTRGNWQRQLTEPEVSWKHAARETDGGVSASAANDVLFALAAPDAQASTSERTDRLSLPADSGPTIELSTPFQPTQIKSERLSDISTSQSNEDEEDSSVLDELFAVLSTP